MRTDPTEWRGSSPTTARSSSEARAYRRVLSSSGCTERVRTRQFLSVRLPISFLRAFVTRPASVSHGRARPNWEAHRSPACVRLTDHSGLTCALDFQSPIIARESVDYER